MSDFDVFFEAERERDGGTLDIPALRRAFEAGQRSRDEGVGRLHAETDFWQERAEQAEGALERVGRLHAETDFWRERAEQAEGALERLRAVVEAARIAAQQLDEVLGRGALASVMDALDALDREEVSRG
jgi:multidrug resistance efflux pump